MVTTKRSALVALSVAMLMIVATACGGSTSTSDSSSTTVASASGKNSSGDLALLGGDCINAAEAYVGLSGLALLALAGGVSDSDQAKMKNDVAELTAKVPSEIKADITTYTDAITKFSDALKGVSITDLLNPTVQDKLQKASAELETSKVEEASNNIEAYFNEKCPIGE